MRWRPIGEADLLRLIADAVGLMEGPARSLWNLIRVRPQKWKLTPWGDEGGGFWVVALIGMQVVWYNDIEDGFNISRYETPGVIAEYWCNQHELQQTILALRQHIETGEPPGKFGPPESLS
jgi:hypothetical protein